MPITYILFSKTTKKFYTGSSHKDDINFRLSYHNSGKVRSTKNGRPWNLVITEAYVSYKEARQRELFLKTGVGRQWIYNKFKV